jgi:hypothetical protein
MGHALDWKMARALSGNHFHRVEIDLHKCISISTRGNWFAQMEINFHLCKLICICANLSGNFSTSFPRVKFECKFSTWLENNKPTRHIIISSPLPWPWYFRSVLPHSPRQQTITTAHHLSYDNTYLLVYRHEGTMNAPGAEESVTMCCRRIRTMAPCGPLHLQAGSSCRTERRQVE